MRRIGLIAFAIKPWPEDYVVMATLPTWDAAAAALNDMVVNKKCGW